MYILDYGLMAKFSNKKDLVVHLSDGVPKGDSFLDSVLLYYNGKQFAILKENADHITCTLVAKNPKSMSSFAYPWSPPITIEKNRVYEKHGRSSTILSTIIHSLTKDSHRNVKGAFDGKEELAERLRDLVADHFEYIFDDMRDEKDI